MLNLTSENPYSEDNFERKFQAKLSQSNLIFEKPEEELIELKGGKQIETNNLSS